MIDKANLIKQSYVEVAGVKFRVIKFDGNGRGDSAMGRCDIKNGEIRLAAGMPKEIRESVLVHEWLHGVLDMYGIEHTEEIVSVLGNELYRRRFRVYEYEETVGMESPEEL